MSTITNDAPEIMGTPDTSLEQEAGARSWSMRVVDTSLRRPGRVLVVVALITVVLGALMVRVEIDTDPENMLSADDPARVVNDDLRATFGGAETIVAGVFTDGGDVTGDQVAAMGRVHDGLVAAEGVDAELLVSVRTAIGPSADGAAYDAIAGDPTALLDQIESDPVLAGNVVSADRDALAVFIPLDSKSDAQPTADEVDRLLDAEPALADLERHVAGLPLAQEAFGDQMFIQMAVFAPLAGLAIFALMLVFFRRLVLVVPAMLLALVAVITTMGLLIGTGNTLHIMSSMIPIFLMPIAILDAIHVISEFFDRHRPGIDRRATIRAVYAELVGPIGSTTATTATGFAALALTPIPPVRVFGVFVAIGVAIAWAGTLTLLPAMLVRAPDRSVDRAVASRVARDSVDGDERASRFARVVAALPAAGARRPGVVLAPAGVAVIAAVPVLTSLQVNDNPVNWFRSGHEIRTATERLGDALPGTFTANLLVDETRSGALLEADVVVAVDELADEIETLEVVGAVVTYTDLLPTEAVADGPTATGDTLADALAASPVASSLVTDDLDRANLRIQLRSGDNTAMQDVLDRADPLIDALPSSIDVRWAGESHLNLVWQDEMVSGMIAGFAVTLLIILVLLTLLFRSIRWALLALAPVLWTVAIVYAGLGLLGRDIDMPVAVLSTMVLGIGVDFAIHFVQRFRALRERHGDSRAAVREFGDEPARALTRNAAVIAIGFSPLLLSSLTPYVIVGVLLASIIVLSWLTTLVALPAAVTLRPKSSSDG
ncbi:MAG: MMPL family transporter [Actinomycetota bacterium]